MEMHVLLELTENRILKYKLNSRDLGSSNKTQNSLAKDELLRMNHKENRKGLSSNRKQNLLCSVTCSCVLQVVQTGNKDRETSEEI